MRQPLIHIAVPNQGSIHKGVVMSLMSMLNHGKKYDMIFNFLTDMPIDNARNQLCRDTLAKGADYLLMLDDDNPPVRNPLDLVEADKDIVVYPTPMWLSKHIADIDIGKNPITWNCMDYRADQNGWYEHHPRIGWQEIDAGGTGCILIARRVLEAVPRPWFDRLYDADGVVTHGSDFRFCQKAKQAGFKVWANYDYFCSHHKRVNLAEIYMMAKYRDISYANLPNINTPEYWDEQWEKRPERVYPQYTRICDLIRTGERVLDFGCGRGDLLALLSATDASKVHGIDFSPRAISIVKDRGLSGHVSSFPTEPWDTIVCTEVLEHLDDDRGMLKKFFECANRVIYSVPGNCLPPGIEREHRRVYTEAYIREITPHLKEIQEVDNYYLVVAERS